MRKAKNWTAIFLVIVTASGCLKEDMVPATTARLRIINGSSDPFSYQLTSRMAPLIPPVSSQPMAAAMHGDEIVAIGDSVRIRGVFTAEHAALAMGGQSTASFDTTIFIQAGANELKVVPDPRKYWGLRLVNSVTRTDYSKVDMIYEMNGQTIYSSLMRNPLRTGQPGGTGCVCWFPVDSTRNWQNLRTYYSYQTPGATGYIGQRSFDVFQNAPQPGAVFPSGQANYYTVNITD